MRTALILAAAVLTMAGLQNLPAGNAGLSHPPDETTGDEAAELACSFNQLMAKLEDMIDRIAAGAERLVIASNELNATASQLSTDAQIGVTKEISGRISDAESRAGSMAGKTRDVAETARSVSAEAQRAADGTRSVTEDLTQVKQEASLASAGATTVGVASADVSSIADQLRDAVGRLGSAARQTG